jgi:serine/threonine protein kinase
MKTFNSNLDLVVRARRRKTDIDSNDIDNVEMIRVNRRLGSGGFGCVYLGLLGRCRVAVKLPRHSYTSATINSLRTEGKLIGLDHPNIVKVLSFWWTNSIDDQGMPMFGSSIHPIPAVVMEFADGRSLQAIIDDTDELIHLDRRIRFY